MDEGKNEEDEIGGRSQMEGGSAGCKEHVVEEVWLHHHLNSTGPTNLYKECKPTLL